MKIRSTAYQLDRAFTDYVHRHLALPLVYEAVGWTPCRLRQPERDRLDLYHGIDRVFYTPEGTIVTVQERFRRSTYAAYQDVTFRYRRDHHRDVKRYSEFYKIQADYLLYGIIGSRSKNTASCTSFRKVVLLQLAPLWEKLRTGEAMIDEARTGKCYWHHQKLIVPVNHNHDGSSSFIALDIPLIARYWPHEIIVYQHGFIP